MCPLPQYKNNVSNTLFMYGDTYQYRYPLGLIILFMHSCVYQYRSEIILAYPMTYYCSGLDVVVCGVCARLTVMFRPHTGGIG